VWTLRSGVRSGMSPIATTDRPCKDCTITQNRSAPSDEHPVVPAGPVAEVAAPGPRSRRPLRRSARERVLGGVCGGIAARLAVGCTVVRVVAVISIALGGIGILAYMAFWVAIPAADEGESIGSRVVADRRELQIVLAFSTALLAVLLVTRAFGVDDLGVPTWSLAVGVVGALVVWRGASPAETIRLRDALNAGPALATSSSKGWRRVTIRAVVGAVLILVGIGELSRMGNLSGAAFGVLLGTVLLAAGFLVLFAPWWARTLRDLSTERRERVRAEERADMAAHVHDSVLQTLALVQKAAGDPREVTRLARIQERELRRWLFDPAQVGQHPDLPETLSAAAAAIEREVEDSYGVGVELIVVGDCPVDDDVTALLAACREATVNAAKWSGCDEVTVFAEVESDAISVYVRDLGIGFDPELVPADRQGITGSIVERMARHRGQVTVASAPGTGTEVELILPRSHGHR
jgi:signal transduction histidine kinase